MTTNPENTPAYNQGYADAAKGAWDTILADRDIVGDQYQDGWTAYLRKHPDHVPPARRHEDCPDPSYWLCGDPDEF